MPEVTYANRNTTYRVATNPECEATAHRTKNSFRRSGCVCPEAVELHRKYYRKRTPELPILLDVTRNRPIDKLSSEVVNSYLNEVYLCLDKDRLTYKLPKLVRLVCTAILLEQGLTGIEIAGRMYVSYRQFLRDHKCIKSNKGLFDEWKRTAKAHSVRYR